MPDAYREDLIDAARDWLEYADERQRASQLAEDCRKPANEAGDRKAASENRLALLAPHDQRVVVVLETDRGVLVDTLGGR